jgi:hypothetical protein
MQLHLALLLDLLQVVYPLHQDRLQDQQAH